MKLLNDIFHQSECWWAFYLLFLILQGKFKIRKIKVSQEKMSSLEDLS